MRASELSTMHTKSNLIIFGTLKHTNGQKAWRKSGLMTLRCQRCFRFTRGVSHHPSVTFEHIKMRNGAMAHLKPAYGPPVGNHCPTAQRNAYTVTKNIGPQW